ncbi:DEAD/DEAH box helicase [Aquimarina megaterium]|uniref:DEAD/DEAH box helicase n=1 Tax=Aquimarina megaterium TaxID=1443666 RepID=UPI00046F7DD3|nr:DEAD/DEAH box helicase [Aquimarina megaterium]
MLSRIKGNLTAIGKTELFQTVFEKLTINNTLSYYEKSFMLATAILFIKHYEKNNKYKTYADIAYYIILKYSNKYNDYIPLYDFSVNFGFFPIVQSLLNEELYSEEKLVDYIVSLRIAEFKNPNDYTETLEQNLQSSKFLEDITNEKAYLAPTSFGKSSIIVDYIRSNVAQNSKVVIVVPTKSLLMQTYRMIRNANLARRIIIHDEMYNGESSFIAIFTQERALRLISRKNIIFDALIVDEAHNLLKNDSGNRQILLSRLIARNLKNNPNQKIIYLSPLVDDVSNLRVSRNQNINSHKIHFNIKEPEIFELTITNNKYQYNRFVNQFYLLESSVPNKYNYILKNSLAKNFIYENSPRKIETEAKSLSNHLSLIENDSDINNLLNVLKQEVHEDFYGIKYLKNGIIYLHGKLPDIIKEYLESKFKEIESIKFLVANSVILEGINLPIDSLFILNTYRLNGKELINLIGRINRLNEIFNSDNLDLNKLLPKVHFINNKEYADGHNKKIRLLRSRIFEDKIDNPTLERFDDSKLSNEQKLSVEKILENEVVLLEDQTTEKGKLKQYLIESGIIDYYTNIDSFLSSFIQNRELVNNGEFNGWDSLNTIEKVHAIFLNSQEISDYEFNRLQNEQARNYYDNYISNLRKDSFNQRVVSHLRYFKELARNPDLQRRLLYVGQTYGEITYDNNTDSSFKNYVNLGIKTTEEIVNLAIVKLKMEDDFISFKLNRFIVMLFDFDLISQEEYNSFIYGTTNQKKIALTRSGLTISLIGKLESDNQLKNIEFDSFNNLIANEEFKEYLTTINDLNRYEMNKYIL